jgi:hypothetical protein
MSDPVEPWVLVVVAVLLLGLVAFGLWLVHVYDRSRRESFAMRQCAYERIKRAGEDRRVLIERAMSQKSGSAQGSGSRLDEGSGGGL